MKRIIYLLPLACLLSCKKEDPVKPAPEYTTLSLHVETNAADGFTSINLLGGDSAFISKKDYHAQSWDTVFNAKAGTEYNFYACSKGDKSSARSQIGGQAPVTVTNSHSGGTYPCTKLYTIIIP